jgi:hypothetical protein
LNKCAHPRCRRCPRPQPTTVKPAVGPIPARGPAPDPRATPTRR